MRNVIKRMLRPRVINAFHRFYYSDIDSWSTNSFLGYRIQQCPFDLQIYHELVWRLRPGYILQTGVSGGGSLAFFAALLDMLGAGPEAVVVGVDIRISEAARALSHPRIRLLEGDSVSPAVLEQIRAILPSPRTALVSLDSDHARAHVLKELRLYAEFVPVDSYMVCEDTNINGHPVARKWGEGPMEAVDSFLASDDRFVRDDALWRRHLFSFHQFGWLRRVR